MYYITACTVVYEVQVSRSLKVKITPSRRLPHAKFDFEPTTWMVSANTQSVTERFLSLSFWYLRHAHRSHRWTDFWATVCKTVRPIPSDRCLSCLSVALVELWPNGWMDQGETWYGGRPSDRPSSTSTKGHSPQFSVHVYCDQTVAMIRSTS